MFSNVFISPTVSDLQIKSVKIFNHYCEKHFVSEFLPCILQRRKEKNHLYCLNKNLYFLPYLVWLYWKQDLQREVLPYVLTSPKNSWLNKCTELETYKCVSK